MFIEVHIGGVCKHQWHIEDNNLAEIAGASWKENVEARELVVKRFLDAIKSFVAPLFINDPTVRYYIIFESKIHLQDDNEKCHADEELQVSDWD